MKAIPNSRPQNAVMKAKGNKPKKKNINPDVIILYVKPAKIFNNIWPLNILAANLSPNETFLAKYEMNSIKTNKGNKPKGQPAGTNKEKNSNPCFWNPNIVAPKTTVKLRAKANAKWLVDAKLYGTKPIKLLIKININKAYIKGKYNWPFVEFIWFVTILCIVAYRDSWLIDQLLLIILL